VWSHRDPGLVEASHNGLPAVDVVLPLVHRIIRLSDEASCCPPGPHLAADRENFGKTQLISGAKER